MLQKYILLLLFCLPIICVGEIIQLNNGDSLDVIIKSQTQDSLLVEHTSLGQLSIKKTNIVNLDVISLAGINFSDTQHVNSVVEASADQGLFATGLLQDWERSIDIGLNGASGPSNNASFRTSFKTRYEDKEDRWDFKSVFIYKQEDEKTTDHQFKADLLKDWFLTDSHFFYFANVGFDWDQFKDWDYRVRVASGPGYQFIKTEHWEFASRVGFNAKYEVMEPENRTNLEGLVGLDVSWKISDRQSLHLNNIYYPGITDREEYRNVTDFEWVHKLDYYQGMAVKLGLHNEYDTTQTEKNDLKYHLSIAWGL